MIDGDPTDEMIEYADELFVEQGLGHGAQPARDPVPSDERMFVLTAGEEQVVAAVYFQRTGDEWFPVEFSYCSDVG